MLVDLNFKEVENYLGCLSINPKLNVETIEKIFYAIGERIPNVDEKEAEMLTNLIDRFFSAVGNGVKLR